MIEEFKKDPVTEISNDYHENWEELLRANLAKNDEILSIARQIKSYIRWQLAWSFIRLFLIIIPIILGFIYLPPLLKEFFNTYSFVMPF